MSNDIENGRKFYDGVLSSFDKAAAFTDFEPGLLNQIKICNSIYKFYFPLEVDGKLEVIEGIRVQHSHHSCLLYTSDAADERSSVDLGGRRIIKKKKNKQ